MRLNFVLTCVLIAAGCEGELGVDTAPTNDDETDLDGPQIRTQPITDAQRIGEDILVEAEVADESGIFVMTLRYRQETSVEFEQAAMSPVGETDGWVTYQGFIRGNDVASGGMRYYFEAVDDSDNGNASCLGTDIGDVPEDCEAEPLGFSVVP